MSKMISVASGFQYSVNIGYDLSSNEKLKNFIPTKSSLGLLEEILLSTAETSTERSRVLIGAYGKGKSHIVLTILSILMKRDLRLFEKLLPKLEEHPKLKQCVLNYYESPNKILPVVITGSNTSCPKLSYWHCKERSRITIFLMSCRKRITKLLSLLLKDGKKIFPKPIRHLKQLLICRLLHL